MTSRVAATAFNGSAARLRRSIPQRVATAVLTGSLAAGSSLAGAAPAGAGTLEGTISLKAAETSSKPVDLYGKYTNNPAVSAGVPLPRPAVVALVPVGRAGGRSTAAEAPVMDQRDLRFQPHVLPIQVGTTVFTRIFFGPRSFAIWYMADISAPFEDA